MNVWGIHNDTLTTELIDEGFVSIAWDEVGDLRKIPNGREGLKAALSTASPNEKVRSIAGQAGVLYRFRDEMQIGDVVVAPYRPDSTINIGEVSGAYEFVADAPTHGHRRRVVWKKVGLPRTVFSQAALYEIGSAITVFRVRKHQDEFLAALTVADPSDEAMGTLVEQVSATDEDTDVNDGPTAKRVDRYTRDFVRAALHKNFTHQEFEEFTAALLQAMGYQARVTQYSQDGGVDVIAHRDRLGVEPPQIKVQCKHLIGAVGAPDVRQLIGTQGTGEHALFVTLGSYTREAQMIERQRTGVRLLNGEDVVGLVLENYERLPEEWRSRMPLASVYAVAEEEV
jgi:restriction system protein